MAAVRVGDLVEVPRIDTVVRLGEHADAGRRRELLEAFVPTEEARRALAAVGRRLRQGGGSAFVLGGYGSGKSHLLAVLAEAGAPAPHPAARALFGDGSPPSPPPLAVLVPLVEQAAARPLEEILLEAVGRAAGGLAEAPTRPERWKAAAEAARRLGRRGLLLLVDELSSFLRAKPTRADLREDVRLLQYLGEVRDIPLCLVATMQESIEAAARPDPEVAQRLRDRFVTLRLGGAHLEEVVAHRLLRHRPGAQEAIAAVRSRLAEAVGLPCAPERFDRLYPVYPPTFEHLDAMRHHLSATRGALDFVYRHLVGDPDLGVEPLLEAPADHLLTPDALFGHFSLRLLETPETAPLVERVDALYRLEGERLFGPDGALAQRVARYLCVEAAGVRPRARTADEVARALAVTGSAVDPGLGRLEVAATLERMTELGAYVVREAGPKGAARYRVDAEADAALVVERRLAALAAGGGPDEENRVLEGVLAALGDDPSLPLATLRREREGVRVLTWERSERRGSVWYGDLEDLEPADVDAWLAELARPGMDFVLALAAPRGPEGAARARRRLDEVLLPAARGREGAEALVWWLPAPVADLGPLRRLDALLALERELEGVADERSGRALEVVREEKRLVLPTAGRLVLDAMYGGEAILGQGDTLGRLEALRVLAFPAVLERLVSTALSLRHPDHRMVMPRGEAVAEAGEEALYAAFFPQGEAGSGAATPAPALALLDGVLVPLGLAERRGRAFRLVTDPARSPALAALAGVLAARAAGADGAEGGQEVPMAEVRRALAKGRLGLDARAVRLTVAAAVFAGLAVPAAGGRRVPLARLTGPEAVERLDALRPGRAGDRRAVPEALSRLPFLAEAADGPYLPAKERELWARCVKWKAERGDPAAESEALRELARHPVLARWHLEQAAFDLAAAGRLAAAVQVSLAPAEGLARLERAAEELGPEGAAAVARSDAWSAFVRREVRALLEAHRYLVHPALDGLEAAGPEGAALAQERRDLVASLTAAPGLLEVGAREAWLAAYGRFVERYRERYAAAHRRALGEDPTGALAALERRWPAAAADARAREARAAVLRRRCTLNPARALEVEPVCPCGYRLGDPPLTEGIAAYADLLRSLAAAAGEGEGPVPSPPAPTPVRRRSLSALSRTLAAAGGGTAAELRRRFDAWLGAEGEERVELDP